MSDIIKQNQQVAVVNEQVPNLEGKFPDSGVSRADYQNEQTAQLGQGYGPNAGLSAGADSGYKQYPIDLSVSAGPDPKQNPTPTENPSADSADKAPQMTPALQNQLQHTHQPAPSAAPTLTRT